MKVSSAVQHGKIFIASFVMFVILASIGVVLAHMSHGVAVFWPANAAMVALILVLGLAYLPSVLLGALLGNIASLLLFGDPLLLAFGLPIANNLEILLVSLGLRALKLDEAPVETPATFFILLGTLIAAVLPGALIGAYFLNVELNLPFTKSLTYLWAGDTVSSVIVLLPLLSTGWPQWRGLWPKTVAVPRLIKSFAVFLACSIFGLAALYALNLPMALAFMVPSCWLALKGKPFKVATVGSLLVVAVSLAVVFGWWPQPQTDLSLRDQVFEAQLLTLLAVLPFYAISVTVADLARSRALITKSNLQLSITLANMNQGVSCFNADHKLTVWNDKYVDMFGMQQSEIYEGVGFMDMLRSQQLRGNFEGDPALYRDKLEKTLLSKDVFVAETRMADGRIIKSVHSSTPLGGWIATHEDVTDIRALERRLSYESTHDALTNLPNRRYFDKEIDRKIKEANAAGLPLTLLFVDLDHFKQVNDMNGHNAGDALLRHAGEMILKAIDPSDFAARLGGDEFAIISGRFRTVEEAEMLALDVKNALGTPLDIEGHQLSCKVSIGITRAQGAEVDAERLRAEADMALYGAKRAGRGQHQVFENGVDVA
ncbi:diguanylate cyclase domain-containing protein [Maritalea mediterranea]|uniref:Diguanylate cyclase n=1 Tax=Maritalea mediterranea TaxID=2909667 RepID=A0ABS9E861_9HYPH|nr:diguanylate cyclase [Maritalea mediterranea]MCF4099056.1 diguanylate cyclase [Maritalea mediterranea]